MALEPMIANGDWQVEILKDDWTAVTKDRSLSAHYEHSVALTQDGIEILSALDEDETLSLLKESRYA